MKHYILQTKAILKASLLFIFLLSAISVVKAQSNSSLTGMSYQTVVRNSSGALVNGFVGIQIKILQGSATGNTVYTETQRPYANVNGLASIIIGSVNPTGFSTIPWASGPFYLETDIDASGGTNYQFAGTNQLMSVPYALYAASSGSSSSSLPANGNYSGEVLYWNGTAWTKVPQPSATALSDSKTGLQLSLCPDNSVVWGTCPVSNTPSNIQAVSVTGISMTGATFNGSTSSSAGFANEGVYVSSTNSRSTGGGFYYNYNNGNGVPSTYSLSFSGLLPGQTYYAFAYANQTGQNLPTLYSQTSIQFTTNLLPGFGNVSVSNITSTSATMTGSVTANGNTVTSSGVCYGTIPNPTSTNGGFVTTTFPSNVNTLTPGQTYYVCSYAQINNQYYYGPYTSFSTPIAAPKLIVSSDAVNSYPIFSNATLSSVNIKDNLVITISNYNSAYSYTIGNLSINGTALPTTFSIIPSGNSATITIPLEKYPQGSSTSKDYFINSIPGGSYTYSITVLCNNSVSATVSNAISISSLGVGNQFGGGYISNYTGSMPLKAGSILTICSQTDLPNNGSLVP